jgi:hypothetical protein
MSGCICEVIIFCVVFTTQDFSIKEKKAANLFTSSKYFTRAFFILASNKLYVVFEPSRLEIFLFCQFWKFRIETDYTFFKSLV